MSARYGVCDDMGIFYAHDKGIDEAQMLVASMNTVSADRHWTIVLEAM